MYYDFELEQIITEVSQQWKINPTEQEIIALIKVYRGAENQAERLRNQLEQDMLGIDPDFDAKDIVDVKPFEDVAADYFRERFFNRKYKGLSITTYLNSHN